MINQASSLQPLWYTIHMTTHTPFEETPGYQHLKAKLLDYLSQRDYSEARLFEKVCSLRERYPNTKRYEPYTPANIRLVINRLKEVGIIDEVRFLENMLYASLHSQYGLRRITQKMYRNKYAKEHIEAVLRRFHEDAPERDLSSITRAVQRRKATLMRKYPDESKHIINKRLFQFVAAKGFSYDEIKQILSLLED